MGTGVDKLALEIRSWPALEKLRLVDAILSDLEQPDPEIDGIWAEEARKRWAAYKAGQIGTVASEDVRTPERESTQPGPGEGSRFPR